MKSLRDKIIKFRIAFVSFLKYFLYGSAIIILILFLIAFISDILSASKLNFSLSSWGIKQLFQMYSTSIQLGTALLAISALILTIERMRQTRAQIESIDHNNRFNNFYKHKDEFIKAFSIKNLYIEFAKQTFIPIESIISDIYHFYFYKSYYDFTLQINLDAELFINNYYQKLNSFDLNRETFDFSELDIEEISQITNSFTEHHILISKYVRSCLEKDHLSTIHSHTIGEEFDKLLKLCKIYYTSQIILDVVSFANLPTIKYNISQFASNFDNYLNKHNLQNCFFLVQ